MKGRSIQASLLLVVLGTACEAVEDVPVQELPEWPRPSAEARVGLPEIAGVWRFAGWELAPDDSAHLQGDLPGLGALHLTTQRLDSVAGTYAAGTARLPVVGEVRRDSVVALVAGAQEGGYYLAGRVSSDTLWVGLTSLLAVDVWPSGARAAFVRGQVGERFVRLPGAPVPLAAVDTAGDTLQSAEAATPSPLPPGGEAPVARPTPPPARQAERAPVTPRPQPAEPLPSTPAERAEPAPPPEPATPAPQVAPAPQEPPRPPRLLGEPVRRDTVPRDTVG